MAYEEKGAWISLIAAVVGGSVYAAVLLSRIASGAQQRIALVDIAYVDAMLYTIGASIVAIIIVMIAVGIVTRRDGHERDLRDKQISARAEFTSRGVLVAAALGALGLAMIDGDQFYIANVLFAGFFLSGLLECITRIALYRRGMPAW